MMHFNKRSKFFSN